MNKVGKCVGPMPTYYMPSAWSLTLLTQNWHISHSYCTSWSVHSDLVFVEFFVIKLGARMEQLDRTGKWMGAAGRWRLVERLFGDGRIITCWCWLSIYKLCSLWLNVFFQQIRNIKSTDVLSCSVGLLSLKQMRNRKLEIWTGPEVKPSSAVSPIGGGCLLVKLSITDVLKCPSLKIPERILLKFGLSFFQVRVVVFLSPILVLFHCPVSES